MRVEAGLGRDAVPAPGRGQGRPPVRRPALSTRAVVNRRWRRRSSRALAADHLAALVARQLAAVVDQVALATGELVGLPRDHPDRQLLTGEVGAGQLEALGLFGLVDVDARRGLVDTPGLELLDRVLGEI